MEPRKKAVDKLDPRDALGHLKGAVLQCRDSGMTETQTRRATERVIDEVFRG